VRGPYLSAAVPGAGICCLRRRQHDPAGGGSRTSAESMSVLATTRPPFQSSRRPTWSLGRTCHDAKLITASEVGNRIVSLCRPAPIKHLSPELSKVILSVQLLPVESG